MVTAVEQMYTVAEAAKLLGLSVTTTWRRVSSGAIKAADVSEGSRPKLRITASALADYQEASQERLNLPQGHSKTPPKHTPPPSKGQPPPHRPAAPLTPPPPAGPKTK